MPQNLPTPLYTASKAAMCLNASFHLQTPVQQLQRGKSTLTLTLALALSRDAPAQHPDLRLCCLPSLLCTTDLKPILPTLVTQRSTPATPAPSTF